MNRNILVVLCFTVLAASDGNAQRNLVPYGDFEGIMPDNDPQAFNGWCNPASFSATPWEDAGNTGNSSNSPSFFSSDNTQCQSTFGVPTNNYGTQQPFGGVAVNHNYVGLTSTLFRRDGIRIQLVEELKQGQVYYLRFKAVKKSTHSPQIEFRFNSSAHWNSGNCPTCSQSYMTISQTGGPNNDQWGDYVISFIPNECNTKWLFLRLTSQAHERKLLIDNISIYDECQLAHLCSGDFGDIDNVYTNGLHNGTTPFTFFNLQNIRNFNLEIKTISGQHVRYINITDPYERVSWDGKNDNGTIVANAIYRYDLNLGNDCRCKEFVGAFVKNGNPQNITAYGGVISSNNTNVLTIFNLGNVNHFKWTIRDASTNIVREIEIMNPQNAISWDGKNGSGSYVAQGIYTWFALCENQCESRVVQGNYTFINPNQPLQSPYFDYSSISKPPTSCPFAFNYNSYVRPPEPCCAYVPDLIFINDHFSSIREFKVTNRIIATTYNDIVAGSDILFQAGNEIEIDPEFVVPAGTNFTAIIAPCTGRYGNPEEPNQPVLTGKLLLTENDADTTVYELLFDDSGQSTASREDYFRIAPNPTKGIFSINLTLGNETALVDITVYNLFGAIVYQKQCSPDRQFDVDLSAFSSGAYYVQATTSTKRYAAKVLKQ